MLQQNSSPQPNPHTCIPQIPLSSHAIPMIASMMPQIPFPCLPACLPSFLPVYLSVCLPCFSVCHTETASWEKSHTAKNRKPSFVVREEGMRDAMTMMLTFPPKCGHRIAMQCEDCAPLCGCVGWVCVCFDASRERRV